MSNRIYVEGEPADIRAFLEAVKWEDELFDFNRIIPRPEILNHTGSGIREIDGKKVESWYIVKHEKYDPPQEQEIVRLFTPEEEAELKAIGAASETGKPAVCRATSARPVANADQSGSIRTCCSHRSPLEWRAR